MSLWEKEPERFTGLEAESRKAYLHPFLRAELAARGCREILDYGCGDGALFLGQPLGGKRIHLYDKSAGMRDQARANFSGQESVAILENIEDAPSGAFDAVALSLVLMTVPTLEEQRTILRHIRRVKKPAGIALIAVTHPCFQEHRFSTFAAEYHSGKEFNYFKEGDPFEVALGFKDEEASVRFTDFHWTLGATLNLILQSGLAL